MAFTLAPRDWQEDEVLSRVLEHDARAWAELVRRYRPVMFRCITRILGRSNRLLTPADCEEVYAEVLMILVRDDMRKLRLYDPSRGAKLGSWVGLMIKTTLEGRGREPPTRPVAGGCLRSAAFPADEIAACDRRGRAAASERTNEQAFCLTRPSAASRTS